MAVDYNKGALDTQIFFAAVENKLHWAIAVETASEIIYTETEATKVFMGLQT